MRPLKEISAKQWYESLFGGWEEVQESWIGGTTRYKNKCPATPQQPTRNHRFPNTFYTFLECLAHPGEDLAPKGIPSGFQSPLLFDFWWISAWILFDVRTMLRSLFVRTWIALQEAVRACSSRPLCKKTVYFVKTRSRGVAKTWRREAVLDMAFEVAFEEALLFFLRVATTS